MNDQWMPVPCDIYGASREEYALFHAVASVMRAERLPDDQPVPLDEFMTRSRGIGNGIVRNQ